MFWGKLRPQVLCLSFCLCRCLCWSLFLSLPVFCEKLRPQVFCLPSKLLHLIFNRRGGFVSYWQNFTQTYGFKVNRYCPDINFLTLSSFKSHCQWSWLLSRSWSLSNTKVGLSDSGLTDQRKVYIEQPEQLKERRN